MGILVRTGLVVVIVIDAAAHREQVSHGDTCGRWPKQCLQRGQVGGREHRVDMNRRRVVQPDQPTLDQVHDGSCGVHFCHAAKEQAIGGRHGRHGIP